MEEQVLMEAGRVFQRVMGVGIKKERSKCYADSMLHIWLACRRQTQRVYTASIDPTFNRNSEIQSFIQGNTNNDNVVIVWLGTVTSKCWCTGTKVRISHSNQKTYHHFLANTRSELQQRTSQFWPSF